MGIPFHTLGFATVGCLEQVPNRFSRMAVKKQVIYHGTIREKKQSKKMVRHLLFQLFERIMIVNIVNYHSWQTGLVYPFSLYLRSILQSIPVG